jgi:hypothetical protein
MQSLSYLIFLFIFSLVRSKEPVDEQHCEGKNSLILIDYFISFVLVCIKTINTFADTLTDEEKTDVEKIEKTFKKYCSKVKVDSKEHRLVNKNILFLF